MVSRRCIYSFYCGARISIIGTDPGIDLNAKRLAMAIIANRPFLSSAILPFSLLWTHIFLE